MNDDTRRDLTRVVVEGWIVLIRAATRPVWIATYSGTIHQTWDDADEDRVAAEAEGYEAWVATVVTEADEVTP